MEYITNPGVFVALGLVLVLFIGAVAALVWAKKADSTYKVEASESGYYESWSVRTRTEAEDICLGLYNETFLGQITINGELWYPTEEQIDNYHNNNILTVVVRYFYSDGTNRLVFFENDKDRHHYEDDNEDIIVRSEMLG